MASTHDPRSDPGRKEDVHAVGVFRPAADDDGRATPAPDRQAGMKHLGRDAARRAVLSALVVGIVAALAIGVVVAVATDARGAALVAAVLGGGAFGGAIGGLWGAFSRLGRGDDWRQAVSDQRPARVVHNEAGRSHAADDDVNELESRGATEVHVVDEDPSPRPESRLDQP